MCLYMYSSFVQFYHFRRREQNNCHICTGNDECRGIFRLSLNNALSLSYIVVKWIEDISHCQTIETGLHVQVKGKN